MYYWKTNEINLKIGKLKKVHVFGMKSFFFFFPFFFLVKILDKFAPPFRSNFQNRLFVSRLYGTAWNITVKKIQLFYAVW